MTTEGKSGSDGKYFSTTKKGDVFELKSDLNSTDKVKVKEAVKKVIAQMTLGQDSVSSLFADVIKNLQTDNIELKKLIYLYIINYARSQPDKAILIVNTFQKDAADPSPLIRALAIRTMGCIRVERITEYLCDPLAKALKDKDPYVRKTAAVCAAKLWDISQELVEEQGFLGTLRDMISDQNPMVVANAVAALAEISEASHKDVFQINSQMLAKLLAALNECTEWGQVFILDCLARYEPNQKDAEEIVERVSPRLKHANSAVAMSAVKVIMKYLNYIKNPKLEEKLIQEKLPPPLITLLSEHKPEIQYVALRNINLIVQKRPEILSQGVKHFFCKYNDPIYVKMEKLEIMIKLAAEKNIEKVLMEFKEYASEVDVEFVRKSVRAIGRCAIKLDKAAERCIKVLLELIQTKVNYVVQEAIIVIKDIFRKYPNKYESIIKTLCENLDTLDEPEAKASMVWIIGEYAGRIKNAPDLLESFVETFNDENPQVQLQLLTAVVKLFLQRPEDAKEMVTKVLNMATDNSDNPDLRDRGYVYWRLLSTDPEAAQAVVLAQKPVISDDTFQLDPTVLDTLIANISTLASIYHKPPEFFVKGGKPTMVLKAASKDQKDVKRGAAKEEDDNEGEDDEEEDPHDDGRNDAAANHGAEGDDDDSSGEGAVPVATEKVAARPEPQKSAAPAAAAAKPAAVADLLGLGSFMPTAAAAPAAATATATATAAAPASNTAAASGVTSPPVPTPSKLILTAEFGKGLQIRNSFARRNNALWMDLIFENTTQQTLASFAIKFNVNYAGVTPAQPLKLSPLGPGASQAHSLPLTESTDAKVMSATAPYGVLQMAIKTELGVAYFQDALEPYFLFDDNGKVEKQNYIPVWKSITDQKEIKKSVDNRTLKEVADIRSRLCAHNIFYVAATNVAQKGTLIYFSFMFKSVSMLLELTINGAACSVIIKSENPAYSAVALNSIVTLLTT